MSALPLSVVILVFVLVWLGHKRVFGFRWVNEWFGPEHAGQHPGNWSRRRVPRAVYVLPVSDFPKVDWKARIEAEMADAPTKEYPSEAPTEDLFPEWPMPPEAERRHRP